MNIDQGSQGFKLNEACRVRSPQVDLVASLPTPESQRVQAIGSPLSCSGNLSYCPTGGFSDCSNSRMSDKSNEEEDRDRKPYRQEAKPKRPLTCYNMFFRCERKRILAKMAEQIPDGSRPKIDFEELGSMISSRWKETPQDERKKYRSMAALDRQRYEREMEEWREYMGTVIDEMVDNENNEAEPKAAPQTNVGHTQGMDSKMPPRIAAAPGDGNTNMAPTSMHVPSLALACLRGSPVASLNQFSNHSSSETSHTRGPGVSVRGGWFSDHQPTPMPATSSRAAMDSGDAGRDFSFHSPEQIESFRMMDESTGFPLMQEQSQREQQQPDQRPHEHHHHQQLHQQRQYQHRHQPYQQRQHEHHHQRQQQGQGQEQSLSDDDIMPEPLRIDCPNTIAELATRLGDDGVDLVIRTFKRAP